MKGRAQDSVVTVVIPTFNRGPELVAAVESVLAQTWPHREVVVVDDGSTDDTASRLRPFQNVIRYVRQENSGVAAARNAGLRMASGAWVAFLDSDDVWSPSKLASQMRCLNEFGQANVCFTDCEFFGNPEIKGSAFERAGLTLASDSFIRDPVDLVLGREPAFWIQSSIIRKRLLLELNGFDETLVVVEDTDLIFRLALREPFCAVSQPLVRISRPESREVGLSEMLADRSDLSFDYRDRMYRKWLRISKGVHEGARKTTLEHLRSLHYCWLVARVYRLNLVKCLENVQRLRTYGESYLDILRRLSFRARRRLGKTIQRLGSGLGRNQTEMAG